MIKAKAAAAVAATVAMSLSPGAEAQCSASDYYSSTVISQFSSQSGSTLQSTIHSLVDGHTVLPYTSTSTDVWDALKETDAWGMDSSTGLVYLIYGNKAVSASDTLGDGVSGSWNREHLWPKSYQVGTSGPDYTDLHHLRVADANVNSARGNLYFDDCTSGCTNPAHEEAAADTAKDSEVFMPPVGVRGDIARAMFYMAARYDGSDSNTIDLELSNCPDVDQGYLGMLDTLLEWHNDDPVSSYEISRNDVVCSFQGNRNPFVDYPDLVERVYNSLSDQGCASQVADIGTEEEGSVVVSSEAMAGIAASVGGLVAIVALVILAIKRHQAAKEAQAQADEAVVSVNPMHATV